MYFELCKVCPIIADMKVKLLVIGRGGWQQWGASVVADGDWLW